MAIVNGKNGTFNIYTKNTAISGYVAWQETYDDSTYSSTNKTTVKIDVYLHRTNIYSGETALYGVAGTRIAYFGSEEVKDTSNLSLSIAGNSSSSGGAYTKVYSASKEITHENDGSKSIDLGYYMTNNYTGNASASNAFKVDKTTQNVTLTTIPRASSVSCSSPYIGEAATIVIASASISFTHTLTYTFGSATGTIATKTSATTVGWDTSTAKDTLYKQIPNAQEGSGTITCQTYSGNTLVGTKTCGFRLYAKKSDCTPDVSGTVVDTNAATITLTGDSSKLIRYMSKPKITITASPKYSSSIKSYSINADGKTINASSTTLDSIASNQITINATDSRKYDNPKPLTPEMVAYIKLNSSLTIARPEQTSNEAYLNGSGQWFNGNFSDSNANTLSINCQYRKSGDSDWIDLGELTPTISGNTFRFSNLQLGTNFDYKNEYQFKITITDKLETIGDKTKDLIILSVGTPIVRIGKNKVVVNGNTETETLNVDGISLIKENNSLAWKSPSAYNVDCNNFTKTGIFYLGSGITNAPNNLAWFYLLVGGVGSQGDVAQLAMPVGYDIAYIRRCINGSWQSWKPLITAGGEPLNVAESRGSWNYPTRGAITVKGDNKNGQHSVIVGLKSDGSTRAYGIDLLDSDSSPQMRLYAGSGYTAVHNNGDVYFSGATYGYGGGTRVYGAVDLYNNTSGSNGTITLGSSSANYDYIEIFFKENSNKSVLSSVKVYSPNGKNVALTSFENTDDYNYFMNIKSSNVSISGTSITKTFNKETNITGGGGVTCATANRIYIVRVIGYK